MKIYAITIAYCPAALLARSLILYRKHRWSTPHRHIVVQGHYPINEKKNTNDIKLIVDCFKDIELWDPGRNLGSAQSQNWALSQLNLAADDYFINLDPDSACLKAGWDLEMQKVLENHPDCALISCMAPMVQRYLDAKNETLEVKRDWVSPKFGIPKTPTPFNLSMWRYSFIKEIGGIPQLGLWWGETEAAFWSHCKARGKYHAYLMDYQENEDGKFLQDKQHNEYKNFHMRVPADQQFLGSYDEYLRWKYPALSEIDTCKNLSNSNHP